MRLFRAGRSVGLAAIVCGGLVAAAQTVMPALRIEPKGAPTACHSLYQRAPFDKPFRASCIARGEADANGVIRATDAACERADLAPFARACLENYRVTEAWRSKMTSLCTEIGFSRPDGANSNFSGSTSVSWVEKCPPPDVTRDPLRSTQVVVTPEVLNGLPPGLLGPNVKVTPLGELPPEVQKAIAERAISAPRGESLRITQDFENRAFANCFEPVRGKTEPFEQSCRVTAGIKNGKVAGAEASCADKSLERSAERCVGSYKLMDQHRGYEGPMCVILTYVAALRTTPDGKVTMSAQHGMKACEAVQ